MQAPRLYSSFLTTALTCLLVLGTPNGHAEIRLDIGNGLALLDAQPNEANPFAAMPAQSPRTHAMALMGESPLPPVPEKTKQRFIQADAGGSATCGVLQGSRRILCWGRNDLGQASPPVDKYRYVAMGENHGCGLTTQGRLRCWGVPTAYPTAEQAKGRFLSVAAGDDHTCAIRANHKLACWGNNDNGELDVPAGKFRQVVARGDHSCGVTRDNRLLCWGEKAFTDYSQTIHMPVKKVATGQLHACALGTNGLATCWGNGAHGENQAPADRFIDIVAGDWHTCGLRANHTALCWGRDQYGQTQVGMDKYRLIAGGGMQTCGILRGSRHLACHGSFANNEVWYPEDREAQVRASQQDGQVRPQLAFLTIFQGVSGLLASGISNTGKMVDKWDDAKSKWEARAVPLQLVALFTNMFIGWFGPKPVDPTIKIFDILKDIQADIRKIEKGIDELKAQLNRTELAVLQSWCDNRLDEYNGAYNLLDGAAYGSTTGARNAYLQLLKAQEAVLTQSIDQQKITLYPKAELDKFRNQYLGQIKSARTKLTNSLIGVNGAQTPAFSACFQKGYAEWKSAVAADSKVYPFDDRPIYDHVYQVLRGALLMQGEMLSMEQDLEMQLAYAKLVEDRPDQAKSIDFNPNDHGLGFCLYADERKITSHPEYNPRWLEVASICQQNRDRIQNAYVDMVRQVEFVGGAYSDEQVVLSMTAEQMGLPKSNDRNWLWMRNIPDENWAMNSTTMQGSVTGKWQDFHHRSDSSPFVWRPPFDRKSDAGTYYYNKGIWTNEIKEEGFGQAVWHSNGDAWDEAHALRSKLRDKAGEKSAEDFMKSMSELPDMFTEACKRDVNGNCETEVIYGKIVNKPGPHLPLFTGVGGKAFWIMGKQFTYEARSKIMIPNNYYKPESDSTMKMKCFMASEINNYLGFSWKNQGVYYDANEWQTNETQWQGKILLLAGKVCHTDEMGAMLLHTQWNDKMACWRESGHARLCSGFGIDESDPSYVYRNSLGWMYVYGRLIDGPFVSNWYDVDPYIHEFKPAGDGNLYHMPVVDISQRKCKYQMAGNSRRQPGRSAGGVNVPSICGEDMDKLISEIIPRPEFPPVPENVVRLPEVN